MHTNPPDSDDRETLCALFDGELDHEAARFAHRRLGHDPQWREAMGRWQLAGDVLRRQAGSVASYGFADPGFAGRVAQALTAERGQGAVVASGAGGVSPASRRRWIPGAALAASVAVAALFVIRPFDDNSDAVPGEAAPASQVASSPTPMMQVEAEVDEASPAQSTATSTEAAAAAAAATVAAAEVPRRRNERRSRGQSQRAAIRASRNREAPSMLAAQSAGQNPSPQPEAGVPADPAIELPAPFQPDPAASDTLAQQDGADETRARPWPRAVLPDYGRGSGYSVGYGDPATAPSSFYPFEPNRSEPAPPPEQ